MAITYPLSLANLWSKCKFSNYTWDVMTFESAHQRKDGKVIASRNGQPKWGGSGTLKPNSVINDSVSLSAAFGMLKGSMGTFLAYDQRRPAPLLDPLGAGLVGFAPQINSISADRDKLSLKLLPTTGYTISAGDYISCVYASVYYMLVRAMETVVANGSGVTAEFYIETDVPVGVVINTPVVLVNPPCICRVIPGSMRNPENDSGSASGRSFSWIQEY